MGNTSSYTKNLAGRPVVVIVGAGYGGVKAAASLDDHYNVVLIDRKDYFLHNIGSPRALVESDWGNNILIPYNKLLKNGHVVNATVTSISSTGVSLHGVSEVVAFDYLIIATGSSYAFPAKVALPHREQALALYSSVLADVRGAKHIVVVGGGPVGVELAGELATDFPQATITLVHARSELVAGPYSARFKAKALESLQARNVKVMLNERLVVPEDFKANVDTNEFSYLSGRRQVETVHGSKLDADLILFAVGAKVNSSAYKEHFRSVLNPSGQLRVNSHLQVMGFDNIFAIGDCSDAATSRMAMWALDQGKFLRRQLPLHEAKRPLLAWKQGPDMMFLSVGRNGGVAQLPGAVMGNKLLKMTKSKAFMAPKFWGELNQPFPKGQQAHFEVVDENSPDFLANKKKLQDLCSISDEAAEHIIKGLEAPPLAPGSDHI